jgi:hypothetical protein
MTEWLIGTAPRIQTDLIHRPDPKVVPRTEIRIKGISDDWDYIDEVLIQQGLAVRGSLPAGTTWCEFAKARLREESGCTRREYETWAERTRAGFPAWREAAEAFKQHRYALYKCPTQGTFVPVTCDNAKVCRLHGDMIQVEALNAPELAPQQDAGACREERILAERGRDMVEGLILAAGTYSRDNRDSPIQTEPRTIELRVLTDHRHDGRNRWEDISDVLVRHGLAVKAGSSVRPPNWCELAKTRVQQESACTRDAYAAWTQRSAAGFTTPQERGKAFGPHFEALEACLPK